MPPDDQDCSACSKATDVGNAGWVECDQCSQWSHGQCVGLDKKDVALLTKLATKGVQWLCKLCISTKKNGSPGMEARVEVSLDKIQSSMDERMQKIEKMMESMIAAKDEQTKKIEEVQQKTWCQVASDLNGSAIKSVQQTVTNLRKKEEEEKKAKEEEAFREKNVILFGLLDSGEQDVQEDRQAFEELLGRCDAGLAGYVGSLHSGDIRRLGRKRQEMNRPLRLTFQDKDTKWRVLKAINGARRSGVFARLDLNQAQQEEDFKLRQELREKRKEGGDWKIVKGVVVPVEVVVGGGKGGETAAPAAAGGSGGEPAVAPPSPSTEGKPQHA